MDIIGTRGYTYFYQLTVFYYSPVFVQQSLPWEIWEISVGLKLQTIIFPNDKPWRLTLPYRPSRLANRNAAPDPSRKWRGDP